MKYTCARVRATKLNGKNAPVAPFRDRDRIIVGNAISVRALLAT
jgi:hypothetical protein